MTLSVRCRMKSVWLRAIDHRRLLALGDLGVLHRGLVVLADQLGQHLVGLLLGVVLRLHHRLDDGLEAGRIVLHQARARGQNAIGVTLAVHVDAIGQHDRALDVGHQGRGIGLDGADPVERARLEGLDGLRRAAHVAHLDVLEGDAVLLQVVVGHDLERIELEGAERLALEFLRRSRPGWATMAQPSTPPPATILTGAPAS